MYGDARPDVGNTFPDFPAALFSGFIANIDTTRIQDGVHTLDVRATDRLGLSRADRPPHDPDLQRRARTSSRSAISTSRSATPCCTARAADAVPIVSPPVNPQSHITPVRGWALDLGTRTRHRPRGLRRAADRRRPLVLDRRLRVQPDLQTVT